MKLRYVIAIAAFILCMFGGVCYSAYHYHSKYQNEKQRGDSAEAITLKFVTAMNLINDISKAAYEEKATLAQKGETHVVYIRKALEGDACARQLVHDSATHSLRELKDGLRTGTSSTNQR
jgi:prophage endopeptidase